MHAKAIELYKLARDFHESAYRLLQELKAGVQTNDNEENADLAYALKKTSEYVDDTRKDSDSLKSFAEKIVCLKWALLPDGEPIRTPYCTATPEPKICATPPTFEKDPDAYEKLMRYLGIDPILWDRGEIISDLGKESTEVVRVHWPGFQSLITRLASQGFPLPDGIDPAATFTLFTLRILSKKGILTDKQQ